MNKYRLYKLLRRNEDLREERHPMFEKNRFMKFLMWFMVIYYAAIMIFMGGVMAQGFSGMYHDVAAFHVLDGGLIVVLVIDFWSRFVLQETPAQYVGPYRLLPIRRGFILHTYLIRSGLSTGNLFWGFFLVPFGLLALPHLMGWSGFFAWLIGWWLIIVANSYMYLLTRSACMRKMWWAVVPAVIHAILLCLYLVEMDTWKDMLSPSAGELLGHWGRDIDHVSTLLLYGFTQWHIIPYIIVSAVIAFFYWCNFRLQSSILYDEVGRKEEVELKHATRMSFLNRYGTMGEYLKMEIKLRMRNRQVKMSFFIGLGAMLLLSALLDFTEVYDSGFMTSFICFYDYIVLGMMTLITIMCYEGNYIDCLMSRRESIYELLRAKYYFNSLILLVPAILIIPSIVIGKITVLMSIGYFFLTIGVMYPLIFQLAVYNKNTIPLNQKLTGKQADVTQNIVSMLVLFLPIGLERLCVVVLGDIWGYMVLIVIGLIGLFTHKLWIRNIYRRFMQRRYINMEGFRASRR